MESHLRRFIIVWRAEMWASLRSRVCLKAAERLQVSFSGLSGILPENEKITIGNYLSRRLADAGARQFFTVPGDFNLALLDEMLKEKRLSMIGCCNELNAGYAGDGNARSSQGLSALVVTYMVGGLSALNAVAGAYSNDLPLICISGGPNIHDVFERRIIHHTIGERDVNQQADCFRPVVAGTFVIRQPFEAVEMIDKAVITACASNKPVYLEIPCNLSAEMVFVPKCSNAVPKERCGSSDAIVLHQCMNDILAGIAKATRPIILIGSKMKSDDIDHLRGFLKSLGCAVAVLPDAKGSISEQDPQFIGCYWGPISSPHVAEITDSSDLVIMVGTLLNDYTTVGWNAVLPDEKILSICPHHVKFGETYYAGVEIRDILKCLASQRIDSNDISLQLFNRYRSSATQSNDMCDNNSPLSMLSIRDLLEATLTSTTTLLAETGDSWFLANSLRLPQGCRFHVQMQYGSIGWSVGATLGVSACEGKHRQIISLIGDGSFQTCAQEISSLIRNNFKATIILLNNDGYSIERQIHDGPYNEIHMWNYTEFVLSIANGNRNVFAVKAATNGELADALRQSSLFEGLSFIECKIQRDECTENLLEWVSKVAEANSRREC